jgi:hypothetical protein
MAGPVIVQGTAVGHPHATTTAEPMGGHPHGGGGGSTGVQAGATPHQPAKTGCNDPIFAILLYVNVAAIVAVVLVYAPGSFDGSSGFDYSGYVYAAVVTAVISVIFSGFGLALNMQYPETMIKIGLIFAVVMAGVWAVMAFLSGNIVGGILGTVFFLCGICYARAVWSRIPFAVRSCSYSIYLCLLRVFVDRNLFVFCWLGDWLLALRAAKSALVRLFPRIATLPNFSHIFVIFWYGLWDETKQTRRIIRKAVNMLTAATAVKANLGVILFAFFFTALQVGWVILWSLAFGGVFNQTYGCVDNVCTDPNYGLLFLLFVAFYFTQQVLQVRVIVNVTPEALICRCFCGGSSVFE